MEKLFKAIGRYLAVTPVAPEGAAGREALVQKFYEELRREIGQIEEAVERQDRERIKEIAQLVLGKAAAAGVKDVAPEAAKLLHAAESERSWIVLRQAVGGFARDFRAEAQPQAA